MTALEFNSVELLHVVLRAYKRATREFARRKNPNALIPDSMVAVVFAAAAVEAFTNDMIDHVKTWAQADWAPNATTPALVAAVSEMVALQTSREREQVLKKYRAATRTLSGKATFDGRELQELGRLMQFRDSIMHATARSVENRRKLQLATNDLARRGIAVPIADGSSANVFLRMQSPVVAKWAYGTALTVILAVLGLTGADAVQSLARCFRDRRRFPR